MKKLLAIVSISALLACGAPRTIQSNTQVLYWSQWLTNIKYLPGERQVVTFTRLTDWTPAPKGFVLNNGFPEDGKVVYQTIWK